MPKESQLSTEDIILQLQAKVAQLEAAQKSGTQKRWTPTEEAKELEDRNKQITDGNDAFQKMKEKPALKMVEMYKKAAEWPEKKAAEEPVKKAAEEPVKKAAEEPEKKAAEEPVKEAAEEPVKEAAEEPVKEAAEVPVK